MSYISCVQMRNCCYRGICSTGVASVHLGLLPMSSETALPGGWSQTHNQDIH